MLAGCAGQPQSYSLQGPAGQENVTVPKGTMLGGASAGQTTALAQEIADTNNARARRPMFARTAIVEMERKR